MCVVSHKSCVLGIGSPGKAIFASAICNKHTLTWKMKFAMHPAKRFIVIINMVLFF